MAATTHSTTGIPYAIIYSRADRDYAITVDGQYIGSAATYHDAEERVLSVHRAAGPRDELDAFHGIEVEREGLARQRGVVDIVVQSIAVDGEQQAGVEVAGQAEAACTDVAVLAVVGDVDTRQAGQRLVDAAPAEGPDVVTGDDAHGRGHLVLPLLVLRCADNGDVQQFLQAELRDVGIRAERRQRGHQQRQAGQQRSIRGPEP